MAYALPDYPDWLATGLTATVQNLEDWCSVHLSFNSVMYSREIQKNNEKYGDEKRIKKMLEVVLPKLGVDSFERVGLRCWFISPVEMKFEQLVEVVAKRFLLDNKEIRDGICPEPIDVAYAVHFLDTNFKVQLRVGPVRRDELEAQLVPNRNINVPVSKRTLTPEELFADLPSVGLLADIDVSRTDVKAKDLSGLFEQGLALHEKLSLNIGKYVFGVKG